MKGMRSVRIMCTMRHCVRMPTCIEAEGTLFFIV